MTGKRGEVAAEERLDLDPSSPLWGDHRSRYHFASDFAGGRRVLDIACGTGLGSGILLRAGATAVVGIDISATALARAGRAVPAGCSLARADGTALPLRGHAFGLVTSFETIEHLQEPARFLAELRRVLTPGGTLVLSTPNALYTKPVDGTPANPFHIKEFTPSELSDLLSPHFGNVRLLGQRCDDRYRACPFWNLPEMLPQDTRGRLEVLACKLESRLPERARERVSQALHHRPFYPGELDFTFTEAAVDVGHVLLAVAET